MSLIASPGGGVRMSAGVVVVNVRDRKLRFLLLRAYKNWDFPKGMVEAGESPVEAAVREVREETTFDDISFDWGLKFMDTGPYNRGKIARYFIARSKDTGVSLPVNPELGHPEHQEARWVTYAAALEMVSQRLQPVVRWAHDVVNHGPLAASPTPVGAHALQSPVPGGPPQGAAAAPVNRG